MSGLLTQRLGTEKGRHVYNAFGYLKEIRVWLDSDSVLPISLAS